MPENIIYIDPTKIKERAKIPFHLDKCTITSNGDWDLEQGHDIDETFIIYTSLRAMIRDNIPWEDTDLYKYILRELSEGYPKWGCETVEACKDRGKYLMSLYEDIKSKGKILLQDEMREKGNPEITRIYRKNDDIYVTIDRNGKILFANNGSHRFSIARILGLKNVPVRVYQRHALWVTYKNELYDMCKKTWKGKSYQTLPHPDLTELNPMHPDKRYDIIKNNTNLVGVKLVDIGSLFGYICYRAELDGYECTAVEVEKKFLTVMRKLKSAYDLKYEIIDQSIFSIQKEEYEIVVAFNIFHHFLKNKNDHDRLVSLLGRLKYKEMFIQFHKQDEQQMIGAYKNYSEDEFARFIVDSSIGKSSYKCIGEESGRKIYKIY